MAQQVRHHPQRPGRNPEAPSYGLASYATTRKAPAAIPKRASGMSPM